MFSTDIAQRETANGQATALTSQSPRAELGSPASSGFSTGSTPPASSSSKPKTTSLRDEVDELLLDVHEASVLVLDGLSDTEIHITEATAADWLDLVAKLKAVKAALDLAQFCTEAEPVEADTPPIYL